MTYETFRTIFVYETIRTMSNQELPRPTDAELEILQILWSHGPCNVRFVNDLLNQQREVGYTTTLKLMQIMTDKGLLTRDADQKVHIYHAVVTESETQKVLLQRFVDAAFRGSAMKLVLQALGNSQASAEELDEIKDLINRIEDHQDPNLPK